MKTDDELGMGLRISRRDLLHDAGLAALGLSVGLSMTLTAEANPGTTPSVSPGTERTPDPGDYPPVRTGLRGSHPGAYETAHKLARENQSFPPPRDLEETYDLVVIGAGISGLAAAHYYRKRFGHDARILLLENHDDFGGHARRNEFHQAGRMRLSMGGTHNLEWWKFNDTVREFMAELGVDVEAMRRQRQFDYGYTAPNSPALWFDADTYGVDRLVTNCDLTQAGGVPDSVIDQLPLPMASLSRLKAFYRRRENVLSEMSETDVDEHLRSISYPEFLYRYGGLDEAGVQLFAKHQHGAWGVEMRALSAMECLDEGYPGGHLLGWEATDAERDYPAAMWPDGNASLVRLQVAALIPEVAPHTTAQNVAVAHFDYQFLDRPDAPVRLRLGATAVNARHLDDGVAVSYIKGEEVLRVRARHCVMGCYHAIIPHLCPELPEAQREAMQYQVKRPLVLTNVLIRNTQALDKLGVDAVYCPGRMHASLFTFRGINTGGYQHDIVDNGPVALVFWGSISPPATALDVKSQHRASRATMLGLTFEDFEREVRSVLDGLLGPAGFDVSRDVLAITVNRWPHGYSYDYLDLWDPDWPEGEAPHEVARRPFGNIAIANSDAGADAYTHVAIHEAWRAVRELPA